MTTSLDRAGLRRWLPRLAVAAAIPALLLTACSSTTAAPSGEASSSTAVAAKSVKLGIAYWDTRTYAFQLMLKGAEAAANANPAIDLASTAPDAGDPSKLLPLFQAMAQTQKDGIVLQTLAADPFYRPVQQVTQAGTPVIAIDAPPPANAGVDLFITNDNSALGKTLAEEILKQVPSDATGEIVIGTNGPSVPPLQARVEGMISVIKAQRPDLKIVGPISTYGTSGSTTENYSAWDSIYQQHPKAVAYLAPGAQDAVSMGLIQQRNNVKLLCGGMDLEPAALQSVQDGYVNTLVSPEHWLKGYIATRILADHALNGTAIPKGTWDTGGLVINAANAAEIAKRQASDEAMAAAMSKSADAQLADPSKYLTEG